MSTWQVAPEHDPHSSIIDLGATNIGGEEDGEPVPLIVRNTTGHAVSNVIVGATGMGSEYLRFAQDDGHGPGVWAEAGREVIAHRGKLEAGESFRVWTRVMSPLQGEAEPGKRNFKFTVKGLAVG
jgi:hypothetical protein